MSINKLSIQIAERALLLAQARSNGEDELADTLEDEIYELEQQLEEEIEQQFADKQRDFQ